ncbi:hypothetical protein GOC16_15780 [Sinorhizobium meliloti]|nr:hypothetical protein [Sinorhizobium meliloti]
MSKGFLDQGVDCDAVLVSSVIKINERSDISLAWLKLVNETNYEQAKQSASGSYTDLFKADYKSFDEQRRKLFSKEEFKYDEMQSRQLLMYGVPEKAYAAWKDCVLAKMANGSLATWVEDMTADGGTLVIRWKLAAGVATLKDVRVEIMGGTDINGKSVVTLGDLQGDKMVILKRGPTNNEVSGTVQGKAGAGGDFASKFSLPPVPPPQEPGGAQSIIEIPARNFNRMLNVEVGGRLPYGKDVVHNQPEKNWPYEAYPDAENMVEYDFYVPGSGLYDFDVNYASEEVREVDMTLSQRGTKVFSIKGCKVKTGTWYPGALSWYTQLRDVDIPEGHSTLRFYRPHAFLISLRFASFRRG